MITYKLNKREIVFSNLLHVKIKISLKRHKIKINFIYGYGDNPSVTEIITSLDSNPSSMGNVESHINQQ